MNLKKYRETQRQHNYLYNSLTWYYYDMRSILASTFHDSKREEKCTRYLLKETKDYYEKSKHRRIILQNLRDRKGDVFYKTGVSKRNNRLYPYGGCIPISPNHLKYVRLNTINEIENLLKQSREEKISDKKREYSLHGDFLMKLFYMRGGIKQ